MNATVKIETPEVAEVAENPISGKLSLNLSSHQGQKAWDIACDAVDFPVHIKELMFTHDDHQVMAEGFTNTGRDCRYYGVVVDRDRVGQLATIATVTGMYDTIPPAMAYLDLKNDLDAAGIKSQPRKVYVSGTGGVQMLTVDLLDMKAANMKDDIKMSIQLVTSIDGSKKHHVRLAVFNETTNSEIVGIKTDTFTINARHTKTLRERHAAFGVAIEVLLKEWNETIQPYMALMHDAEFDKGVATKLLKKIMEKAALPERHIKKCLHFYENDAIVTEGSKHSVYRVVDSLSQYIDSALAEKPERAEKFKENIIKKSHATIEEAVKKFTS